MQMRFLKCEPVWASSSHMSLGLAVLAEGAAVVPAGGTAPIVATVPDAGAGAATAGAVTGTAATADGVLLQPTRVRPEAVMRASMAAGALILDGFMGRLLGT
jgi:hypothetical protein